MRLVDVLLASIMLGLAMGLVHTGLPGFGAHAGNPEAGINCGQSKCERMTWIRTPLTPRLSYSE